MAAHKTHDAVARLLRVGAGEMQPLIGPDVAFGGHFGAELTASGATSEIMNFRHLESAPKMKCFRQIAASTVRNVLKTYR
jgi:hypothetical protein